MPPARNEMQSKWYPLTNTVGSSLYSRGSTHAHTRTHSTKVTKTKQRSGITYHMPRWLRRMWGLSDSPLTTSMNHRQGGLFSVWVSYILHTPVLNMRWGVGRTYSPQLQISSVVKSALFYTTLSISNIQFQQGVDTNKTNRKHARS